MHTSDHLYLISSTHLHSVDLFVVGDGLGHRSEAQLLREGALRLLLLLPTDAAAADAPPDGGVVEQTLEAAALPRRRAAHGNMNTSDFSHRFPIKLREVVNKL